MEKTQCLPQYHKTDNYIMRLRYEGPRKKDRVFLASTTKTGLVKNLPFDAADKMSQIFSARNSFFIFVFSIRLDPDKYRIIDYP